MRIALISEWIDPWRGGAETSTLQFMNHLLDEGVEVHLFTRSRPSERPGLIVRHIGGASMSRTRSSMTFAHRVEYALKRESFDLRHAITPCRGVDLFQPRGGTVAESVERNLALIDSISLRVMKRVANRFNIKQQHGLRLERSIMRDPNGPVIIAISDYVARQLHRHYALPDARIRKVFNGVNPCHLDDTRRTAARQTIRAEFGIGEQDLLVLLVAHNFKLKGVGRWMDALALLMNKGERNIKSLVIGKGDDPVWHRRAAALGLNGHLNFVGPTDRVVDFYAAADILLHPTYYDPCSRVVLEAMAFGLPCIASQWDGASEVIEDGSNGFVLSDPSNVAAMADRVLTLADPQKRRSLAQQATRIGDRIGMDRHTRELLAVYRELCPVAGNLCPTG